MSAGCTAIVLSKFFNEALFHRSRCSAHSRASLVSISVASGRI